MCYFYNKDYCNKFLFCYEDEGGELCEMICLSFDDELYSLNIEIWEGGEIEVLLMLIRLISDIVDLFFGDVKWVM